jgi:hypothetical protein
MISTQALLDILVREVENTRLVNLDNRMEMSRVRAGYPMVRS